MICICSAAFLNTHKHSLYLYETPSCTYNPHSTCNSCLVSYTQLTGVIRSLSSDMDVQPHTEHFCCWSQSVCKWIIQYSEVVNGIIRGEQTLKLSVYHSRWEDAGLVFVNALLIPLELSHPFTPGSGREALNPLVCILKNQYTTIKETCKKLSLAASVQIC